jgi:GTP-binding protein
MINVVIVGRPNVGKSSLFNRIIHRRKAVVEPTSGVTRDRLLQRAEWRGKNFFLTDTGGYVPLKSDRVTGLVAKQVDMAIEEGDVILFTVDVTEGITPLDREIADSLRKNGKVVFLVVNKVDSAKREQDVYGFFKLGFKKVFPLSSIHGRGVAALLDEIAETIPPDERGEKEERIKLAIIGKPNVGKSSFFNRIINEERVIVDEKPGTTRDAIDTDVVFEGEKITIIDTAGIRRKPRVETDLEYYSIKRAISALLSCDAAMVLIDGSVEITRQDKRLLALAGRSAGTVVVILNKMDLVPKKMWKDVGIYFHEELSYIQYRLMVPISAKTGEGVSDAVRITIDALKRSAARLDSEKLNQLLKDAVAHNPHKRIGKRKVVFWGCRQVSQSPPHIIVYTNLPEDITKEYRRFIEKKIREIFPLQGIPLVLKFKRSKREKR